MPQALRSKVAAVPLALLLAVACGSASAAQEAVNVAISVRLVPTSGACGAQQAQHGFEVQCGRPVIVSGGGASPVGGLFTGDGPGGSAAVGGGAGAEALDLLTDATGAIVPPDWMGLARARRHNTGEISSWRLVSFHNGAYVELTIAW